jgi:hypothetical protein
MFLVHVATQKAARCPQVPEIGSLEGEKISRHEKQRRGRADSAITTESSIIPYSPANILFKSSCPCKYGVYLGSFDS